MNESTARNIRVQDRYDELMRIGKHGHYETMFQVVREETESLRQQLAAAHELIRLIFESTPPYHEDGSNVFSDSVIEKWKELLP